MPLMGWSGSDHGNGHIKNTDLLSAYATGLIPSQMVFRGIGCLMLQDDLVTK